MSRPFDVAPASAHELTLGRVLDAPRRSVFRAWTEAETLKRWFAPAPYTVSVAELDVRPGGSSLVTMRGPDGIEMPNRGVYLDVERDRRLVFTDAFREAWVPSDKPFMTVLLGFEDEGGGTRYTVRVRHWSAADRDAHERMGFHPGWGLCADQLEAVAASL